MKPLVYSHYTHVMWIAGLGFVASFMFGLYAWYYVDETLLHIIFIFLAATAFTIMVGATIFGCKLLYRAWAVIPEDYRRTSPAKAVGYLFVLGFNLYWIHVAYKGWAEDYLYYLKATNQIDPGLVDQTLFDYHSKIEIAELLLPWNTGISSFLVQMRLMKQMCAAVNREIDLRVMPNKNAED